MSNITKNNTGGGGGGTVNSLTPDVGGAVSAVGGTIPTLGQKAGTLFTMETYNDGAGNFRIADQTWITQYVVDPSTTPGLKGTFTTIQAAVTQAIADGHTFGNPASIVIRNGTYTENINLVNASIVMYSMDQSLEGVTIVGNLIGGVTSTLWAQNINFTSSSGVAVATSGPFQALYCNVQTITINSGTKVFRNCTVGFSTGTHTGSASFFNCNVGSGNPTITTTWFFVSSTLPIMVLSGGGDVIASYSAVQAITGTSSGISEFAYCTFSVPLNINGTGSVYLAGNTDVNGHTNFITPGATAKYFLAPTQQGSIQFVTKTATNLTITFNMQYVGVTSTSSAFTMTLPNTGNASFIGLVGQTWTFKDESGAAATNNITIATNGGTIDGAASIAISTNYGFATVLFDGTNYFTIAKG